MITEFSIDIDKSQDYMTVHVRGEIDIYTCGELKEAFADVIETSTDSLILNLEHVEYIDSTGLGTIAHAAQRLHEKNFKIIVVCKKPQIKKIFQVSGLLTKNIVIYEAKEDFIATIEEVS